MHAAPCGRREVNFQRQGAQSIEIGFNEKKRAGAVQSTTSFFRASSEGGVAVRQVTAQEAGQWGQQAERRPGEISPAGRGWRDRAGLSRAFGNLLVVDRANLKHLMVPTSITNHKSMKSRFLFHRRKVVWRGQLASAQCLSRRITRRTPCPPPRRRPWLVSRRINSTRLSSPVLKLMLSQRGVALVILAERYNCSRGIKLRLG